MSNSDNSILVEFLTGLYFPYTKTIEINSSEEEIIEILNKHFYQNEKLFQINRFSGRFVENKKFTIKSNTSILRNYSSNAEGIIISINEKQTLITLKSGGSILFLLIPILFALNGLILIVLTFLQHKTIIELIGGVVLIIGALIISGLFKGMNTSIVEDFSDFIREKTKN